MKNSQGGGRYLCKTKNVLSGMYISVTSLSLLIPLLQASCMWQWKFSDFLCFWLCELCFLFVCVVGCSTQNWDATNESMGSTHHMGPQMPSCPCLSLLLWVVVDCLDSKGTYIITVAEICLTPSGAERASWSQHGYQPRGDSIPACGHNWADGGKSGGSWQQGPKLRPFAQSISMASSGEVLGYGPHQ